MTHRTHTRRHALRLAAGGIGLLACCHFAGPGAARAAIDKVNIPAQPTTLKFRVLWKGDDIGYHSTTIMPSADARGMTVTTRIAMKVKIGFITAFRYEHDSTEVWQDGLLKSLVSRTHDDGDDLAANGEATPNGFKAVGPDGPFTAPADSLTTNCMWLETMVGEKKLIDAQNGVVVGLVSKPLGEESVKVRGKNERAERHSILTPFVAGSLWYDADGNWVRSKLEIKGETLEYSLAT